MTLPMITADQIARHIDHADAVDALERALRGGLDPAGDIPRSSTPVDAGELLYMPSQFGEGPESRVGAKLLSIAPENPSRGKERIQGTYLLMDGETLSPIALVDGVALTGIRTSAVSALAARHLASARAEKLVVFGSGPQAKSHIAALRSVLPIKEVVIIGRDGYKAEGLAAWAIERGLRARIGQAVPTKQALSDADIVVCATTAAEPLFEDAWLRPGALAIAVGSHEPAKRELPGELLGRASVVVEDPATAMREAGDVIMAVQEGRLEEGSLIGLRELVLGEADLRPSAPRVFKSVGQSWEDLVVASAIVDRVPRQSPRYPVGGIGRSRRV